MSEPRVILFDLFDTLVDLHFSRLPRSEIGGRQVPTTLVSQHQAILDRGHRVEFGDYVDALRSTDRQFRESHFEKGREVPTIERFSRLVESLDLQDSELAQILTGAHMGQIRAVAETPSSHAGVLKGLSGRYRLALCSNFSDAATALAILEEASLRPYFSAVSISETVGIRKPRPEIFQHALAALEVEAGDAVHVGDNLDADVRGAGLAGLRTIWARRRVAEPDRALQEYDGPAPTWVVDDIATIGELF